MKKQTVAARRLVHTLIGIALLAGAGAPLAWAGEHALGISMSSFSAADESTEATFDVDSGPIPHLFYSYRDEGNAIVVSVGVQSWERIVSGTGGTVTAELDFIPIVGSYRYYPWPDKPASLYFGGGLGLLAYDAQAEGPGFIATETGALTSIEPLIGFEARAGRAVRFHGEVKYSWQILTANDLDLDFVILDVDMSGLYATAGVSFRVGGD